MPNVKQEPLSIRFSATDRTMIAGAAAKLEWTESGLVREVALAAARAAIKPADRKPGRDTP